MCSLTQRQKQVVNVFANKAYLEAEPCKIGTTWTVVLNILVTIDPYEQRCV